jgi:hypothetical protein
MGGISYTEQLDTLKSQLNAVLDDFKKYYIFSKKNPNYADYISAFAKTQSDINSINASLFRLYSAADSELQKLIEEGKVISKEISGKKEELENIKMKLQEIARDNNGSHILIENYKELYKHQYIRNLTLFLGIILVLRVTFNVFIKKPIVKV